MKKKTPAHPHRYLNHTEQLLCVVCGSEAPKINILDSSLRKGGFTKKGILEYYNITKEQAKRFFVYKVISRKVGT
jgi:hypothetical protein